ncbi:MAG: hypothetical protein ABWX82_05870 [Leifsonia sp.]
MSITIGRTSSMAQPHGVARAAIVLGLALARWGRSRQHTISAGEFSERVTTADRAMIEADNRRPFALR